MGIKTCVIIDPDSTVNEVLKSFLQEVGIAKVEYFDDGLKAWGWLRANPEPDIIIQEWRLPKLTGPLLLQRIRQHGFLTVQIVIISSLITGLSGT